MEDEPLQSFEYGTERKAAFLIAVILLSGAALSAFFAYKENPDLYFLSGVLALVSTLGPIGSKKGRAIKIYEDRIACFSSPFSFSEKVIKFTNIVKIESRDMHGIGFLKIYSTTHSPIDISDKMIRADLKDFKKLLDEASEKFTGLEKQIKENIVEKNLKKFPKWVPFTIAPLFYVIVRHVVYEQNEFEDWSLSLGIILIIMIGNWINFRAQKSLLAHKEKHSDLLATPKTKKVRMVRGLWTAGVLVGLALSAIFIKDLPTEGNIYEMYFILYAGIIAVLIVYFLLKLMPESENYISKTEEITGCLIVWLGFVFALVPTLQFMNIHYSSDKAGSLREVVIKGEYYRKNIKANCYKISDWDSDNEIGTADYCSNKYPRIKEGDKVSLISYDGFLGLPFIDSVSITKYEAPALFIENIGGEFELRFTDIRLLIDLKGKYFWDKQKATWKKKCNSGDAFINCRIHGYLKYLENDKVSAKDNMVKGCKSDDMVACGNYFFDGPYSKSDKVYALGRIKKLCKMSFITKDKLTCNRINWFESRIKSGS